MLLKVLVGIAIDLRRPPTQDNTPLHRPVNIGQSANYLASFGRRDPLGAKSKDLHALWPKQSSHWQKSVQVAAVCTNSDDGTDFDPESSNKAMQKECCR